MTVQELITALQSLPTDAIIEAKGQTVSEVTYEPSDLYVNKGKWIVQIK
jgi:hypothetical protein